MQIQHALGSDIIMCLDHCPPSTASGDAIEDAVDHTLAWAAACQKIHQELCAHRGSSPLLFCVIQGGLNRRLRQKCAEELIAMDFDGYAVGGLAVGESEEEMLGVLDDVCPLLPKEKPRYLMGIGVISQMQQCVARGIDMFDSVVPMRLARHGTILLSDGTSIRIVNAPERHRHEPIDPHSPSPLSRTHSRSYLHHLMKAKERFGETIACMQNMAVTLKAMQDVRAEIERNV